MSETIDQQLTKYLADAHSIEEQALQQLRSAPDVAGDDQLARIFREHLVETEGHEQAIRARLEARGESPSKLKDLLMRVGGVGFLLFARAQPDTPGKLVAHAYSYEHLEVVSYGLLAHVAARAGDEATVDTANRIQVEERRMAERLADSFDLAVEASLRRLTRDDLDDQLNSYLADAHAIEAQAIRLLEEAPDSAGRPELAQIYASHLEETRRHQESVASRLEDRGAKRSMLKDAAMGAGGLSWGTFFEAHPDTPGKLAAFAFAFEHLEIAAYEELGRVAERAGDSQTVILTQHILREERAAAEKLASAFDTAAEASLSAVGVGA